VRRWALGVGLHGVVSQGVPTVNTHAPARGRHVTAAVIVLSLLPAQTERVLDSMDIDYMRMVAEAR
jgi:predicted phage gp36 major capsid-like protein